MLKKQSISVFFPAYNDEGAIVSLVENALTILPQLTDDFEVIVVNDGSTDSTPEVLDGLARTTPYLKVIHHEKNQGYGAALRTGFLNASKDLVFYTDGDGQYDVKELKALHPLMTDGVDVVNGYKIKRADKLYRTVVGGIYCRLARLLFRLPIRDVDCDFRLMRREIVQSLNLKASSGVICVELVRKLSAAGCTFAEVPVNHYPRLHGRSQFFTFNRIARTGYDFFRLWVKLVLLRHQAKSGSAVAGLQQ